MRMPVLMGAAIYGDILTMPPAKPLTLPPPSLATVAIAVAVSFSAPTVPRIAVPLTPVDLCALKHGGFGVVCGDHC